MTTLRLAGCTPEPLSAYLKALAVLRLVAEQKDAEARGVWENDVFALDSCLDEDGLLHFFLEEFSPTPIVAPWNGGSGFYEGDRTEGLEAIRATTDPRFSAYRDTIEAVRGWPELPIRDQPIRALIEAVRQEASKREGKSQADLLGPVEELEAQLETVGQPPGSESALNLTVTELETRGRNEPGPIRSLARAAGKVRTKAKSIVRQAGKEQLVQAARQRLGDRTVEWVDAAVALSADGKLHTPWLLGSGGNEGRLDYTNVFMRSLARVLIEAERPASEALLRNGLFGLPTNMLGNESVGQFEPGRAGGFNQGPGIEHKDFPSNPWSFVLSMEGTIVWASTAARRNSVEGVSSPFMVHSRAVGFPSATRTDDARTRAEVWAPIWARPLAYRELRAFFGEGRADVGRRRARDGIEFAEAAASLGVDRGVSQFVRYGLVRRRGDSYIALPEGRFDVRARREADLVRQLEPLLARVDGFLRAFPGRGKSPQFASARRTVHERIHAALSRGGATAVKDLVAALGRMERLIAQRDRSKAPKLARPLAGLRPAWIAAASDGSVEVRIAAALASIAPTGKVGPFRANLSPVNPERPYRWADHGHQAAWRGNTLTARLAGVLARRMMDAERVESPRNPLYASITLPLWDVAAFLDGALDEGLLEDLLFGFSLVEWRDRASVAEVRGRLRAAASPKQEVVPTSYCLLKLLFLPGPLALGDAKVEIRPEAAIVPLLRAGRVGEACRIAQRRLFAAGLRPVTASFPDGEDGTRLAAALLLPVSNTRTLARRALLDSETRAR